MASDQSERENFEDIWGEMGLSNFSGAMAAQYVAKSKSTAEGEFAFARVNAWLHSQHAVAGSQKPSSTFQMGCPEIIPGLRALHRWNAELLPELQVWLSERWLPNKAAILNEVHALCAPASTEGNQQPISGFQEYRAPSWAGTVASKDTPGDHAAPEEMLPSTASTAPAVAMGSSSTSSGQWNVYYLELHNVDTTANRKRCPVLASVVDALPGKYGHAFLSAMAPGTHITPHHGPTNKKLRIQLPLSLPPDATPEGGGDDTPSQRAGCAVRVGECTLRYESDAPLIFDDSFEHEAWNMCSQPRLVLIMDVWHPDLTPSELKFMQFLRKAQLRAAKAMSAEATKQGMTGVDFFAILEDASSRPVDVRAVLPLEATEKAPATA